MTALGLSDDVMIAKIRAAAAKGADAVRFDTSANGLKSLKTANVPDAVIQVMINPTPQGPTLITAATSITLDPNLPPPEIGVYWRDGANFVLIQGQALTNMKAGGKAGAMFTNGLRNLHWDAFVEGPISNNVVRDRRPAFYLYVPDGNDASDYALIKMNKEQPARVSGWLVWRHYRRQVRGEAGQGSSDQGRTRWNQNVSNIPRR